MCGILGMLHHQKKRRSNAALLRKMADALQHRGPDADGFYNDEHCELGFRRLAIIDLRKKANQPMCNEDKTIWLVFNGEIYNFKDIRADLEEKGHTFQTDSDSEVILHGYEQYQEHIVKKLRGMFAFAVWDSNTKKLFLARDRIGKKPLFYFSNKDKFVFASELKSLLQDDEIPRIINPKSLWHYLSYGYVPSPQSIFQHIYKLEPACYLTCQNGVVTVRRYWNLNFSPIAYTEQHAVSEIRRQLEEAVKIRMISDVPLGAFLSGGIDSSSIVAIMAQHADSPIKTFSIGFQESSYDETRYARLVAEKYKTDHHEFIVKPDAMDILPRLVWHYDEPYADASALPTYYLSQLTRKYVTVALNGDGGDENFAGYDRYNVGSLLNSWKKLPALVTTPMATIIRALPHDTHAAVRKARRFIGVQNLPSSKAYIRLMQTFTQQEKGQLCQSSFALGKPNSDAILQDVFMLCRQKDLLSRMMFADIKRYLPDDLLVKVDRATMAHALEARSPYLDHVFMEFASTIPPSLKLHGMTKKYILKKALAPYLPRAILKRKKMGFGVPIESWFRGELQEVASSALLSQTAAARGYFRKEKVAEMLQKHASGHTNAGYKIWNLLCLELWHRLYVDAERLSYKKLIKKSW